MTRRAQSHSPSNVAPKKGGAPALQANVAELRALAHPLRLRILELFAESPRTTKQVAALLDQPPTRLYHHVNALERAGLVQLRETRPNRGTIEKWYGADARFAAGAGSEPDAVRAVALTVLEQSVAEVERSLRILSDERDKPVVVRALVIGPPSVQRLARRRLEEFLAALSAEGRALKDDSARGAHGGEKRGEGSGDADERWALTIAFAPVTVR